MKRQGLKVTIAQLNDLAEELEKQTTVTIPVKELFNTKFQVNIINKTGLSDDWELEWA